MSLDIQNKQIEEKWAEVGVENENLSLDAPLLHKVIEEDKLADYKKEINRFDNTNNSNIRHQNDYSMEFEDYKDEYGKLPKTYNKMIYLMWIVFLVILEIPTNYTTIEQFLHKPAVSMLVTIAIGSLLVLIAHSHGGFFKQISFIIKTANSESNHNVTPRVMRYAIAVAGFVGIVVIFYGLYYARLQYFNTISGVDVNDPFADGDSASLVAGTIFTKVGILMLANFAIYALGIIGSYLTHDTIPGYQEAYFKVQKFNKVLRKEYLKMETELNRIAKKVRSRRRKGKDAA